MLTFFVLLVILIVWGLKDGDIYWPEAAACALIGAVCFAGLVVNFRESGILFVVATCLLDVYLLVKVVGNPSIG